MYGERRGVYRVSVGKPKGKRETTWKTQEMGLGGGAWTGFFLARDRDRCRPLVNAAMNYRIP